MDRLVALVQSRATERARRFEGQTVEVLVEGQARRDPGSLRGRNRQNRSVVFEGTAGVGDLVEVEITDSTSQTLRGTEVLNSRILA